MDLNHQVHEAWILGVQRTLIMRSALGFLAPRFTTHDILRVRHANVRRAPSFAKFRRS
ncbi:hypothetical protein BN406_04453 (plasmid) [Sinorhizobium meliloti Rm41]|nr:hypothetical protein BN406_04453 [Sinorhizobium meliloti Rm41]